VFNVDYHLSPEAKFPVAVNDAYAALCWAAENAGRYNVDADRIMVAGDSAGGNLCIVTCLIARDRGGPKIRFHVPIYPSVDHRPWPQYPSRLAYGGGQHFLISADIEWMVHNYLNADTERDDWRASPIVASSFAGMPPALIVTASHDPLCDEGKIYSERLARDSVHAEYACFEGTIHGFASFANLLDVGKRGMTLICDRIRKAGWD
jgi:acetyl esterase